MEIQTSAQAFGAWLYQKRLDLKRRGRIGTQDEISRKSGVPRSTIASYEAAGRGAKGISRPGKDVVRRLAVALEASEREALLVADYSPEDVRRAAADLDPLEVDWVNTYRLLPPDEQMIARQLLKTWASKSGATQSDPNGRGVASGMAAAA